MKRRYWPARALLAALVLGLVLVGSAQADPYWNVYQGNLPDGSGVRHKTTLYGGSGESWTIRESWTDHTHDMYFLEIESSGTWHSLWVQVYGAVLTSSWDRWIPYGGFARAGCQNPGGYSTVWVNCRNALSY